MLSVPPTAANPFRKATDVTILYGVTFPEPIMSLPRQIQKGIPGALGWDRWVGWSISVDASRVLISQEPVDLSDSNVQGVSQAAMDEHEANVRQYLRPGRSASADGGVQRH